MNFFFSNKAEEHLSKNKQYDEAQHMKHLIAKLEPVEKKKFQEDYQHTLDKLRERNEESQAFARRRLDETVDTHEWAMKRKMGKRGKEERLRVRFFIFFVLFYLV